MSTNVGFYSDASTSKLLGYGCILGTKWLRGLWNPEFIAKEEPSIEYLELFALTASVITWAYMLSNCRIILFCDNTAVVGMINKLSSSCKNCMVLLWMLTLNGLQHNRRLTAHYISTKSNFLADSLSRAQMSQFRKLGPHMDETPYIIHEPLWPMEKNWIR